MAKGKKAKIDPSPQRELSSFNPQAQVARMNEPRQPAAFQGQRHQNRRHKTSGGSRLTKTPRSLGAQLLMADAQRWKPRSWQFESRSTPNRRSKTSTREEQLQWARMRADEHRKHLASELAHYLEMEACHLVANEQIALQLAFRLVGLGPGDELWLPAIGAESAIAAALAWGLEVRLLDVRRQSPHLDPEALDQALQAHPVQASERRALLFADACGFPGQVEQYLALAESAQMPVIEYAPDGIGGGWRQQRCPSFAPVSVASLSEGKPLGPEPLRWGSSAAALWIRGEKVQAAMSALMNGAGRHGEGGASLTQRLLGDFHLETSVLERLAEGFERYEQGERQRRLEMAAYYDQAFTKPLRPLRVPAGVDSCAGRYLLLLPEHLSRQAFVAAAQTAGIHIESAFSPTFEAEFLVENSPDSLQKQLPTGGTSGRWQWQELGLAPLPQPKSFGPCPHARHFIERAVEVPIDTQLSLEALRHRCRSLQLLAESLLEKER